MTKEEVEENYPEISRELKSWIDPLQADERRTLELFCRLVEELESDKIFSDWLQHGRIDWGFRVEDGNVVSSHIDKLDETQVRAFVPASRGFTTYREQASIRKTVLSYQSRVSKRHPIWLNFNA